MIYNVTDNRISIDDYFFEMATNNNIYIYTKGMKYIDIIKVGYYISFKEFKVICNKWFWENARKIKEDKLKEFKRKCLEFVDSKTMREYLNERDDVQFSLKELLSIVYNSNRTKRKKIIFYRELEENFQLTYEESEDVKRLISGSRGVPKAIFSLNEDSNFVENIDYNKYVENLYVYVPTPFRIGDIVKVFNKKEKYIVINSELPTGEIALKSDWIDMCITVIPIKYKYLATEEYLKERKKRFDKCLKENILFEEDEISRYHEHFYVFCLELVEKGSI